MKALLSIPLLFCNLCFAQNTIVWSITDTVNKKSSIIVGTFHHIGNSFVDSIPVIQNALMSSDIAVFESIDDESVVAGIVGKRTEQNEIKDLLNEDDFSKLMTLSSEWETKITQMKPIELLLTLRRKFQISKCRSVKPSDIFDHFDNYLIHLAKKNNKTLLGLENDSLQLDLLDKISDTWNVEEIRDEISIWISKITGQEDRYEECEETERYMKFDLDYEFTTDCEDDILVKRRNQEWISKLTDLVSRRNCFIAVGLLHLNYTCGLLESFRKQGFVVSPVSIKSPVANQK